MKRIISLKKISPFLTEVFREDVKIGRIDYQNVKDYTITLDDTIAQSIIDSEIAEIIKIIKIESDKYFTTKTSDLTTYVNTDLKNELENYNQAKKIDLNTATNSNLENISKLSNLEKNELKKIGTEENQKIALTSEEKIKIIDDLLNKFNVDINTLLNANNITNLGELIGKEYKGIYQHQNQYNKGDIYYKKNSYTVGINLDGSLVVKKQKKIEINNFYVNGDSEILFNLSSYKKNGIVKIKFGSKLVKTSETNVTTISLNKIFNIVKISIVKNAAPAIEKYLQTSNLNNVNLTKKNNTIDISSIKIDNITKIYY